LEPVLITFHPHPKVLVTPDDVPMLLTTIEEKKKFIPDFLEGRVLVLDFDQQLRSLSAEEFVRRILIDRIGIKKLIVGYDHAFGKDRSGTITELKGFGQQYGFDVTVVDPVIIDGKPVSSTRIRRAMLADRYPEAIRLLGHEYAIYGTVERGIGLGRKIGYPTANLKYNPRKLLPPSGVYSCWAQLAGDSMYGMVFIGQNHFNPAMHVSVEANLFDLKEDIYGEEMVVYPCEFVRRNRKFETPEELTRQIESDKQQVLKLLNKGEKACP
jgi:riboflavin kinase/FMN adenylyltransferase